MKICYECKQEKELENFHKDSTKIDGYYTLCKSCRRNRSGVKEHIPAKIIGHYKDKFIVAGSPYPRIKGLKVRAHRYIMEDILGRKLFRQEHVHHLDGDKLNFKVENLVVIYEGTHHRQHPTPRGEGKMAYCNGCGKEKWYNRYELSHSYGNRPERIKMYLCKNCGGGGRKKG